MSKAIDLENGLPAIKTWANNKFQQQESGKGLSTEDYTTAEKEKLATVESGAQPNVVTGLEKYDSPVNAIYDSIKIYADGLQPPNSPYIAPTDQAMIAMGAKLYSELISDVKVDNVSVSQTITTVDSTYKIANIDLSGKAPLNSPALTGTPTAPTAAAGTNNTQIATTAFVSNAISTSETGAAKFKGVINSSSAISGLSDYKNGWYWTVGTAGTYVGQTCEAGDFIFCISDFNTEYSASDFAVVQNNIVFATAAEVEAVLLDIV